MTQKELLETALYYCLDLVVEWIWKKGEPAGNAEEFAELKSFICQLKKELAKPEQETLSQD